MDSVKAEVAKFAAGLPEVTPAGLVQCIAVFAVKRETMNETNEDQLEKVKWAKTGLERARARENKTAIVYFERQLKTLEAKGFIPDDAIEIVDQCLKLAGQEFDRRVRGAKNESTT